MTMYVKERELEYEKNVMRVESWNQTRGMGESN